MCGLIISLLYRQVAVLRFTWASRSLWHMPYRAQLRTSQSLLSDTSDILSGSRVMA